MKKVLIALSTCCAFILLNACNKQDTIRSVPQPVAQPSASTGNTANKIISWYATYMGDAMPCIPMSSTNCLYVIVKECRCPKEQIISTILDGDKEKIKDIFSAHKLTLTDLIPDTPLINNVINGDYTVSYLHNTADNDIEWFNFHKNGAIVTHVCLPKQ